MTRVVIISTQTSLGITPIALGTIKQCDHKKGL